MKIKNLSNTGKKSGRDLNFFLKISFFRILGSSRVFLIVLNLGTFLIFVDLEKLNNDNKSKFLRGNRAQNEMYLKF